MKNETLAAPLSIELSSIRASGLTFISPGAVVAVHQHHCYQIAVALDEPFNSLVGNQSLTDTKGFIANKGTPHSCNTVGSPVLIHFVEASSLLGQALGGRMNGAPYVAIDQLLPGISGQRLLPKDYITRPASELRMYIDLFLQQLLLPGQPAVAMADNRIRTALEYIDAHLDERLRLEDIAAQVYLSPERARHLFAEQTGMPFTQYVLWKRIREIIGAVASGRLTGAAACIQYGFTDYPHFSRIFRRMFGVAPNGVLRNCRVIL